MSITNRLLTRTMNDYHTKDYVLALEHQEFPNVIIVLHTIQLAVDHPDPTGSLL